MFSYLHAIALIVLSPFFCSLVIFPSSCIVCRANGVEIKDTAATELWRSYTIATKSVFQDRMFALIRTMGKTCFEVCHFFAVKYAAEIPTSSSTIRKSGDGASFFFLLCCLKLLILMFCRISCSISTRLCVDEHKTIVILITWHFDDIDSAVIISKVRQYNTEQILLVLLMMTAESMLSKRPVFRIIASSFFPLKLFPSPCLLNFTIFMFCILLLAGFHAWLLHQGARRDKRK